MQSCVSDVPLKVSNGSVVSQHSTGSSSSQQISVTHVSAEDQGTKKRKRCYRGGKGKKSGLYLPNPGDSGRSKAKKACQSDHSFMGEDS